MIRNHVDRFHVAIHALRAGSMFNDKVKVDQHSLISQLEHDIKKHQEYIFKTGKGETF